MNSVDSVDSIGGSINNLIIKTYGGLFAFWIVVVYALTKFLKFLGECMAEGAINKGISRIIPIVKVEFKTEFDALHRDISVISDRLSKYSQTKHEIDGENKQLRQVIIDNDPEIFSVVREAILRQNSNKKNHHEENQN